eukprot:3035428-Rhodomonas_salina.1
MGVQAPVTLRHAVKTSCLKKRRCLTAMAACCSSKQARSGCGMPAATSANQYNRMREALSTVQDASFLGRKEERGRWKGGKGGIRESIERGRGQ